jgi:hypothetical protein
MIDGGESFSVKEKSSEKGIVHFTIYATIKGVDRIEIWGDEVQKVENLSELFGKKVYIRTVPVPSFIERLFNVKPEHLTETGEISVVGYIGSVPLLQIGSHKRAYLCLVKRTREWPGYDYPSFKKAPQ